MKIHTTLLLLALSSIYAKGQKSSKISLSFRGGYCSTTNSSNYFSLTGTAGPRRIRSVFCGFELETPISNTLSANLGFAITPKGFKTTASSADPPLQALTLDYRFNLSYLEMPLGVTYRFNPRFTAGGGAVVSYLIKSTFLYNYQERIVNRYTSYIQQSDIDHLCKDWDFGLYLCGTMNLYKNLDLEVRLQKNFIEPYIIHNELAKQQTFFVGVKYRIWE